MGDLFKVKIERSLRNNCMVYGYGPYSYDIRVLLGDIRIFFFSNDIAFE